MKLLIFVTLFSFTSFSQSVKSDTNMTDDEYINFVVSNESKSEIKHNKASEAKRNKRREKHIKTIILFGLEFLPLLIR